VRQPVPHGHPRRDGDREVDAGRDDALDLLGGGKPLDGVLVLDRDDRPAFGPPEARRSRVAVDRDDMEAQVVRRLEQADLPGAGP
jgi:hypothetical protein